MGVLVYIVDNYLFLLIVVFFCLVVLVMFGYFLVCKYVLEVGGLGILEIEGVLED